ncbi:double-strand break repair helicase AddA [Tanticharoenia sakaeratensis]|uniref:DNA 3'-5' helicase n=1 Tax=Tanticharoenia sakaeratensis NBRC 103193 TaxID=1231623 RepID=A0A0D6MIP1_9PROT|nr:double-strand break repair helicase AddA [Tanticharoenia sakaeratensis]GAN53492.1 double-strand break repair helicase AddA [Tanticharoenia sakaeratensis NBRC 103193]GBQ17739.1 DNA helicase II [Tanticharoenia sakaeratensis NBRC 103193]
MHDADMNGVQMPDARATAIAFAGQTQNIASSPEASVFVSASAGSGKTKLLIDRLLRLMLPSQGIDPRTGEPVLLPGTPPGRILCLTFTKAAAAEMAIRLQDTLGRWVSLSDAALDRALGGLDVPTSEGVRAAARALFVAVLDLPGGMRIGTIHAFCQSLLRRFPLEAAVNPHFTLLEETDSRIALHEAVEAVLADSDRAAVERLAAETGLADFTRRVGQIRDAGADGDRLLAAYAADPARVRRAYEKALGIDGDTLPGLQAESVSPPDEKRLVGFLRLVMDKGSATIAKRAALQLDWLGTPQDRRDPDIWRTSLLTAAGAPRVRGGINPKLDKDHPEVGDALLVEAERQIDLKARANAVELLALNMALLHLATPALARFGVEKAARGLVDYDDLIAQTRALLQEPGAAWVLYKLDGGIDHLLLDEVQDTSAAQWEIAGALTQEFFSGEGARDDLARPRTVFAVGDSKQSIYAFQGADPAGFVAWRHRFDAMVRQAGQDFLTPGLTVSFRSVEPVLKLVDAVFARQPAASGVREAGASFVAEHISARPDQGGRVELWPLVPASEAGEEASPWVAPSANAGQQSAPQRLADALARWIADQIGQPPQPGQAPLRAGEVLVLVPRRSAFVTALIRALKTCSVPVATLVRVELTEQIAVRDLMALCEVLLLPQDDLTLGCVLTSPLGDLSDDSLMDLALGRGNQPLWSVLRSRHAERKDWAQAWGLLAPLYNRVDYATPYQLLTEALGRLGGRARLLRRLGPEAAEPVDELLSAALRYEGLHPPSLQGFLHWLRASETTVKREPEAQADAVRVMTVHGAKGLQARLVVLPDTASRPRADNPLLWTAADGMALPLWQSRAALATGRTRALGDALREQVAEERNRLLYVALTRASDWLVICGWSGAKQGPGEDSWYRMCEAGFEDLEAHAEPFALGWEGERRVYEIQPRHVAGQGEARAPRAPVSLPRWLGAAPDWRASPPVAEPALTRPLAPSRPEGAAFGPLPAARSPLQLRSGEAPRTRALRRGVLIHRLLQLLPDYAAAARPAVARRFLSRAGFDLNETQVEQIARQAISVLTHPVLAPVFGADSRAEQAITGIAGGSVVVGQVDRLRIADDAVYLCDFKTNQSPPRSVETVPDAYLRQMAAYRAVLAQVAPGRPIRCLLVWTETGDVMALPDAALDAIMALV